MFCPSVKKKTPKPIQNKKSTESIFFYIFEKDDAGTKKISMK